MYLQTEVMIVFIFKNQAQKNSTENCSMCNLENNPLIYP